MQEKERKYGKTMKLFVRLLEPNNTSKFIFFSGVILGCVLNPLAVCASTAAPVVLNGVLDRPQKSLLEYTKSYFSVTSWKNYVFSGGKKSKEFDTFVLNPLKKSVVPITLFTTGAFFGSFISGKIFDAAYLKEIELCYNDANATLFKFKQILETTENPFL